VGEARDNLPGLEVFDEEGFAEGGNTVALCVTVHRYFPCPCLAYVGNCAGGGGVVLNSGGGGEKRDDVGSVCI
jgi:hypothetical protein